MADTCCQLCNTCLSCESCDVTCEACDVCNNCQVGCEVACQACDSCNACDICNDCQVGCEVVCEACDVCNNCQAGCEVVCEACDVCNNCQVGCEVVCEACDITNACGTSCDTCNTCLTCDVLTETTCTSGNVCDNVQSCNGGQVCSACDTVCNSGQTCTSGNTCDNVQSCTSGQVCNACNTVCNSGQTPTCTSGNTCDNVQSCSGGQICSACNSVCNSGQSCSQTCTSGNVCTVCNTVCNTGQAPPPAPTIYVDSVGGTWIQIVRTNNASGSDMETWIWSDTQIQQEVPAFCSTYGYSYTANGDYLLISGLPSGKTYYFKARVLLNGVYSSYSDTISATTTLTRPTNWNWSYNITSGGAVYNTVVSGNTVYAYIMTAIEWNNFTEKINEFRRYKGLPNYGSFISVVSDSDCTPSVISQAIYAINALGFSISDVSSGNIQAQTFISMRDALNSIT